MWHRTKGAWDVSITGEALAVVTLPLGVVDDWSGCSADVLQVAIPFFSVTSKPTPYGEW
jgi:hypothetical protein